MVAVFSPINKKWIWQDMGEKEGVLSKPCYFKSQISYSAHSNKKDFFLLSLSLSNRTPSSPSPSALKSHLNFEDPQV